MIVSGRDSGIEMMAFEMMMMLFLHCPVAVSETIRPSRSWPAEQEKNTKQRDEEALHTVLCRGILSLTNDET